VLEARRNISLFVCFWKEICPQTARWVARIACLYSFEFLPAAWFYA
jgi:hypothetical protein